MMRRRFAGVLIALAVVVGVPSGPASAAFSGCSAEFKGTTGAAVRCSSTTIPNAIYRARVTCRTTGNVFVGYGYGPWVRVTQWSAGYCPSGTVATSVLRQEA